MPPAAAAIVVAGIGMISSMSAQSSSRRTAREGLAQQERFNLQAQQNFEKVQEETVQDRVKDAQAAGISPLAALGVGGSSLPSFSTGARRAGTGGGGMQAIQKMMSGIMAGQEGRERQKDRVTERESRATNQKTRAETDALRMQTEMARLRLAERKIQLMGASSIAEHQAQTQQKMPIYQRYYDNRDAGQSLAPGEMWVPVEQFSEGMEGTGGSLATGYAWGDEKRRQIGAAFGDMYDYATQRGSRTGWWMGPRHPWRKNAPRHKMPDFLGP